MSLNYTMNKRILVLNVEASGINQYLFSQLRKRGWDLEIIAVPVPRIYRYLSLISTFRPNKIQWRDNYYRMLEKFIKSPACFLKRSEFCKKKIAKLSSKFDIILQIGGLFAPGLNGINLPYATYNDYTMKLAEREYRPWSPFDTDKNTENWYSLEKKLYQNAARVFTFSNRTRESIIHDYEVEGNKVFTVNSGANLENIPNIPDKDYSRKIILFVGVDFERKGGYILLEAFKKVRKEINDAKLIIVGPQGLNIDIPGVEMKGYIRNREEIKKIYMEATIFVMPSIGDPFPNVLFEAMAYKIPCIGSDVSGIPEQIKDKETGFIVPANDTDKLAEKIILLLKNIELMKMMGENGYKRVKDNFTWDKAGERIDFYLKECLGKEKNYV